MPKKTLPYLLLLILLLLAGWWLTQQNGDRPSVSEREPSRTEQNNARKPGFDRSVNKLEFTRHARCRMQCRFISEEEVSFILKNGAINYRKSNLKDMPCPTYALEGYTTPDHQHIRIIFAQCDNKTKVVTCIDLDKEYSCNCN